MAKNVTALKTVALRRRSGVAGGGGELDPFSILNALPSPVIAVDGDGLVVFANAAAEQFLQMSRQVLQHCALDTVVLSDSPLFTLIEQARQSGTSVSEYGVTLESPRIGSHYLIIEAAPLVEAPDTVVLYLQQQSIARKMGQQLTHRNAARSVTAMSMMLAHELKNPISGIRGAAQLLEQTADEGDRELTTLIRDEADRIVKMIDQMGVFADDQPIERSAVNIHSVLEHVRKVSQNGFARDVRFVERYDPSLPPVLGNRDLLIQCFLNLLKNAAEAVGEEGEIVIETAYQHGVRLAVPGSDSLVHLPLVVSVRDNGPGIPEDLRANLFDPFVTTKPRGKGLGLALVAKVVGDHGGVIEFDSAPRRTVFRVMLPVRREIGLKTHRHGAADDGAEAGNE